METPTSASCVQITPDVAGKYRDVEPLPEARVLTSLIHLPDQTILALNGARRGAYTRLGLSSSTLIRYL